MRRSARGREPSRGDCQLPAQQVGRVVEIQSQRIAHCLIGAIERQNDVRSIGDTGTIKTSTRISRQRTWPCTESGSHDKYDHTRHHNHKPAPTLRHTSSTLLRSDLTTTIRLLSGKREETAKAALPLE